MKCAKCLVVMFTLFTSASSVAQPVRITRQEVKCYMIHDNSGRRSVCEVRQSGTKAERLQEVTRFQSLERGPDQDWGNPLRDVDFEESVQFEPQVQFEEPAPLQPQDISELFELEEDSDAERIPSGFSLGSPAQVITDAPVLDPASRRDPHMNHNDLISLESNVVFQLNQARRAEGMPALRSSPLAAAVAEAHSRKMCQERFFSHQSSDGSQPWDRLRAAGGKFKMAAENIASGYTTAEEVHQGWMNSPGHRKNRLNPDYTHVGVGLHVCEDGRAFWTELFYR